MGLFSLIGKGFSGLRKLGGGLYNTVNTVAKKLSRIPVIGELGKAAWEMSPYSDYVQAGKGLFDAVTDIGSSIGKAPSKEIIQRSKQLADNTGLTGKLTPYWNRYVGDPQI